MPDATHYNASRVFVQGIISPFCTRRRNVWHHFPNMI